MAKFVHFYGLTPDQFWDLDVLDYRGLARYMNRYEDAEREAMARAKHRGGRRGR